MSNELINLNELGIENKHDDAAIASLTKSSSYLPALRVYGSSATIVKQNKFPNGHFGLYFSADKILDLGEQTDVLVIAFRPRASIFLSDEQPISFFDPVSEAFLDVQNKGLAKVQGYQFGLEYLLWIASVKQFGLFFMGNPTLRRESDNVKSHIGKAATLKIKFIPSKQYGGWHGCETLSCDSPFDIPPTEDIKNVYESMFKNPVDSEVELAESGTSGRAR